MPTVELNQFYKDYSKALDDRSAALFVGAGISAAANLKTWPDLLDEVAEELGLSIDRETDLVALAQYHVNTQGGTRSRLNQLVKDEYDRPVQLTENHALIARLPIETVWTTNYDRLLERAYDEAGKRYDVKMEPDDLATTARGKDVTLYKMHGCVTHPSRAVLTKEDYELFNVSKRSLFSTSLKGDLIGKTFLFLGFSFTDANIDYILSRIKALLDENPRRHYCIMRWPQSPKPKKGRGYERERAEYDYNLRKMELRVTDLVRYGIHVVRIDDYGEITGILRELNRRAHRRSVFVSGSAHDFSPLDERRVRRMCHGLGQALIRNGFNLVSGFGLGIGSEVLGGSLEEVYRDAKAVVGDRVLMRPFPQVPQSDPGRADLYTRYRRDIISQVGATVFLFGNRLASDGVTVEVASGMEEEFEICKELEKVPIPVGATGWVAETAWKEVTRDLERFFPAGGVNARFQTLGDPGKSEQDWVDAVIAILKHLNRE